MSEGARTDGALRLRPASDADIPFVVSLLRDQNVRRYLGGPVADPELRQAARALLTPAATEEVRIALLGDTTAGLLSLTHHKDGQDIELSYQFKPEHWGKGLASNACRALLRHGFEAMHLPRIIAETQLANARSTRLLTRLGFVETARITRFGAIQILMCLTPEHLS